VARLVHDVGDPTVVSPPNADDPPHDHGA
jgi:hypothetical protein